MTAQQLVVLAKRTCEEGKTLRSSLGRKEPWSSPPPKSAAARADATEPGAHDASREARVRYLALLACINSVSLGYQIGAVTVSNGLVKRHLNLSNAQLAAYEASVNIAAIAGAILSGLISEELGRRNVFLISAFVFSAGSVRASSQLDLRVAARGHPTCWFRSGHRPGHRPVVYRGDLAAGR